MTCALFERSNLYIHSTDIDTNEKYKTYATKSGPGNLYQLSPGLFGTYQACDVFWHVQATGHRICLIKEDKSETQLHRCFYA